MPSLVLTASKTTSLLSSNLIISYSQISIAPITASNNLSIPIRISTILQCTTSASTASLVDSSIIQIFMERKADLITTLSPTQVKISSCLIKAFLIKGSGCTIMECRMTACKGVECKRKCIERVSM